MANKAPKPKLNPTFMKFLGNLKNWLEAAGRPHLMVVSCFDLRYPVYITNHLEAAEDHWFHEKYDHVSLAGAGLAGVVDFPPHPKPNWSTTFMEQIALSKKLHNIGAVVVLEHRTCGAYKEFGLLHEKSTRDEETKAHETQTDRLKAAIKKDFPDLLFFRFLLEEIKEAIASPTRVTRQSTKLLVPVDGMISFVPLGRELA
jgi:hypothetical protein